MSNKEAEKYSANQTVQRLNLTNRFHVAVSKYKPIGHFRVASVSKRVFMWTIHMENEFRSQFHSHANQIHLQMKGFAR